ncbi:MAG: hypothetical protein ACREPT_01930 [Rudaea sp.]
MASGWNATAGASDPNSAARDLQGTWQVQVVQVNCLTGATVGLPFSSLLTFARGGTMTETTDNSMFYPAVREPGLGVWHRLHGNTYYAASMAFITLNGVLAKTQKISQTIEVGPGPDEFNTTQAAVQFFDPAGNLLGAGCAVASGVRFE